MSKREIVAGAVDQTVDIFISDSSSTIGAGLTGLVYNSGSLVCYYRKGATGAVTQLSLATQTVTGAHSDGGFVELSSANMPGAYRLDLSDTMVASAGMLTIELKGATNMAPVIMELEIVAVNKFDAVRMGLTALPNAAADAAGGLPISDAGGLDMDARLDAAVSSRMATFTQPTGFLAATFPGTVASPTNITAGTLTTVTTATNLTNNNDKTGYALSSAGVQAIWDALTAALTTASSIGKLIVDNLNATISSRATQTSVDDLPTNSELATALGTADDAVLAQVALVKAVTDKVDTALVLDGAVYQYTANALELAPTGGSAPTVVQIRQEMDSNSTQLAAIVADTNELQTDWVNGGRLDNILDARASQSSVDTIDNFLDTEIADILIDTGTTIPAQIAALNNISTAQVNAEMVDVLRTDLIPDSYPANGVQPTIAQALLAILQFLTDKNVTGTTLIARKPDGTTTAMTFTLDDATSPTDITRTS